MSMPAAFSLGATILTWFAAVWPIGSLGAPALDIQAATGPAGGGRAAGGDELVLPPGLLDRLDRRPPPAAPLAARRRCGRWRSTIGLVALGFTSVYREGFEIVPVLQALRVKYGSGVVLEGVALGGLFTIAVGVLTFVVHHKLPYKKMLVLTGALLGVGAGGDGRRERTGAPAGGMAPGHALGVSFPGWVGTWFALFPTVETVVAQALAAVAVIGVLPRRRAGAGEGAPPPRPRRRRATGAPPTPRLATRQTNSRGSPLTTPSTPSARSTPIRARSLTVHP